MTVKGCFERYGTLDLSARPAVRLTIEAASLDTKRDQHLRSPDFFDVEQYPQVRFVSDSATLTPTRSSCADTWTPIADGLRRRRRFA